MSAPETMTVLSEHDRLALVIDAAAAEMRFQEAQRRLVEACGQLMLARAHLAALDVLRVRPEARS